MTKFSKGDEIECISSLGRIGLGEKFIVIDSRPQLSAPSFHPELVYIEVDGFVRNYSPKHFELVKPATPVFAEGSPLKPIYEQWWGKNKEKSFAQQIAEEEVENMSRDNIVNKTGSSSCDPPKKSEWFGYKYQVNPETSKLLQEAVFKDGGRWSYPSEDVAFLDKRHLYVDEYGHITWGEDCKLFHDHDLPEKQPPKAEALETKKEFKEGYWYKCVDSAGSVLIAGKYYNVVDTVHKSIFTYLFIKGYGREYSISRFDINSESPYDPTIEVATPKGTSDHIADALSSVVGVTVDKDRKMTVQLQGTLAKVMIDLTKQTEEKQTMSNTNRRVVNVKLLDNDSGLPVEYALVAQYQGIVTEDSDAVVINEILLNKNVANEIAKHNEKRVAQTDLEILKRTGNDVKLRQVKLKDLTWIVSAA